MMKIIFVSYVHTPDYKNPAEWLEHIKFYTGVLQALAKKHEVISIELIDFEGEYVQNFVHYRFKRISKPELYFPIKLHHFIKATKPDVVIVHGLHFSFQIIQLRMVLGKYVKIIAQHHAEAPFKRFRKPLQQLADKYIKAYLFASKEIGIEWVEKGNLASAAKIFEVMEVSSTFYPLEREKISKGLNITKTLTFLWVGRLNNNKDPLTVVKAFLQFSLVFPSAKLFMIYQSEELLPDISNLIDKYPIDKCSITLIGKVPHQDLLYWYNNSDFIISGSKYEGSGTAVCEAMSCGCIPIVTDIPAFRMITNNGQYGLIYQPGNPEALLSSLKKAIDIDLFDMRTQVIDHFKDKLSFDAIASDIEQVILSD